VRTSESDSRRPIYTIEFQPELWVEDPTRVLKALLKIVLRRFGLCAVSVEETHKVNRTIERSAS
jgi:hypothetical protein